MNETLYPMHARVSPESTVRDSPIPGGIMLEDDWECIGRYRAYRQAAKSDERMGPPHEGTDHGLQDP